MEKTLSYFSTLLYKDFFAYTSRQLQQLGLSYGALPFLVFIGKHPDCTPTELTQVLHMDWGHCQRSLRKLEDGGFLRSLKDGRSHHLSLTDRGNEGFALCHQVFRTWDQAVSAELTPQELETLLSLLAKISIHCEAPHYV